MKWEFVSARKYFADYAKNWDKLNFKYYGQHPYFDSRFIQPLISLFSGDDQLLAIGREDGLIKGMVLLERSSTASWRIFRPSQAQIAPLLLVDVKGLRELVHELPGVPLSVDFLCQDPLYSPFNPDQPQSNQHWVSHVETMGIKIQDSFDDYWSTRTRNLRKSIARRLNKYEADLRFVVHGTREKLKEALDRYGIMESRGWKGKDGTAIHPENIQGEFYHQLLEGFSRTDGALIYELYIGTQLAASQISIGNGMMLVMLKTTYDEGLAHLAPGRVLQYKLLQHEFSSHRHQVLEYYTNATEEQRRWATHTRQIYHVGVARSPATQSFLGIARLSRR